jgi:hypothetical protein
MLEKRRRRGIDSWGLEWRICKGLTMAFCMDWSFKIGVNTGEYKESGKQ